MDLFIQAFISFGGYLILTYFIYNILNHKRTIPLFIYGILFIAQLSNLINLYRIGASTTILLLFLMRNLAPVMVAFFVFLRITGGFGLPKYKREKKLKSISTDAETVYLHRMISIVLSISGVLFGTLAYFFVPGWTKWLILTIGSLVFVLGLFLFYAESKVKHESILVIIGRDQKRFYMYEIPQKTYKVAIKTFFLNDNYIVDPIGKMVIKDHLNKLDVFHVYWIATQDHVDMKEEHQLNPIDIPFEEHIEHFEKYHYRIIYLHKDEQKNITLSAIKQIK